MPGALPSSSRSKDASALGIEPLSANSGVPPQTCRNTLLFWSVEPTKSSGCESQSKRALADPSLGINLVGGNELSNGVTLNDKQRSAVST